MSSGSQWLCMLLGMALAHSASALEFRRLKGSADGEDAQQWLYFSGEAVQFALAADPGAAAQSGRADPQYRALALFLTDGRDLADLEPSPIDYQPGAGLTIDPQQVWLDQDERLLALQVTAAGGQARWQVLDVVSGKRVLETGAVPPPAASEAAVWSWPRPLPAPLDAYDGLQFDDWRGVLEMPDRVRVQTWRTTTRAVFGALSFTPAQDHLKQDIDSWLSAYPPETLGDAKHLLGDWRVRSIQARTDLGLYDYPWFRASIHRDPRGGLSFAKTTGSQRRSGLLLRDLEQPGRLIFAGSSTVNDEAPRDYSRLLKPPVDEEVGATDSVGEFILLSATHAVLVLDPADHGFEIYELER